jgi:hypothetical protein
MVQQFVDPVAIAAQIKRVQAMHAVDNSLLPQKKSLLGIQKFPAPLRREFGCNTSLQKV